MSIFPTGIPPAVLPRLLNARLADDVRVRSAIRAADGFHAISSALGKHYTYRISWSEPDLPWQGLRSAVLPPPSDPDAFRHGLSTPPRSSGLGIVHRALHRRPKHGSDDLPGPTRVATIGARSPRLRRGFPALPGAANGRRAARCRSRQIDHRRSRSTSSNPHPRARPSTPHPPEASPSNGSTTGRRPASPMDHGGNSAQIGPSPW